MKNPLLSNRSKLYCKIQTELSKPTPNIDNIMLIISEFEKNNLKLINSLKREKIITVKRINGGLKCAINAHGPIDKNQIQSASKRIFGQLIAHTDNKPKLTLNNIDWKWVGLFIGLETISIILYLIINE